MSDTLRPAGYQLVPLTKLLLNQANAVLVADGVGVGKTISAGYVLDRFSSSAEGPCLVVSPPTLVDKWHFELRSKFRKNPRTIRSEEELQTTRSEFAKDVASEIYVCSYSVLDKIGSSLQFPVVVIDEIHNFRNTDTQRWRSAMSVAKKSVWRIGLSATPINNSVSDLGSELSILFPRFSADIVKALIEDTWRAGEFSLLAPFITRFDKEQLGIHFAKRTVHDLSIQFPRSYAQSVQAIISEISGRAPATGSYPIDTVTYFREAASSPLAFENSTGSKTNLSEDPKLQALLGIVQRHQTRLLVFCQFLPTVAYLRTSLRERETFALTGDVPVADREDVIDSFRRAPNGVMLLTSVGSEGLDLQFCNVVVNYDLHWNPMVLEQRIGRCDRVGQEKSEILVYNLRVQGSIDDRVIRVLGRKLRLLAGSPLSQKEIIDVGASLYDEAALDIETKRATALLRAVEFAESLKTDDVTVLPDIVDGFCQPGMVAHHSPTDWLVPTVRSKKWLELTKGNASTFLTRMKKLQDYVA